MDDVEHAFRQAHGQALATLTRVFGDLTVAEDAVQNAYVTALDWWPREGVPGNPASLDRHDRKNRAIHLIRRHQRAGASSPDTSPPTPQEAAEAYDRAAALARTNAEVAFLSGRRTQLAADLPGAPDC